MALQKESKLDYWTLLLTAFFLLVIIAAVVFALVKSERVDRIAERIKGRSSLCNGILLSALGIALTLGASFQANDLAREHLKIAERETPPLLTLEGKRKLGGTEYVIKNEKASHLTFPFAFVKGFLSRLKMSTASSASSSMPILVRSE